MPPFVLYVLFYLSVGSSTVSLYASYPETSLATCATTASEIRSSSIYNVQAAGCLNTATGVFTGE